MRTKDQRLEVNGAKSIQSCIRIYLAKMKAFNLRCVNDVMIIKNQEYLELHGPEKLTDLKTQV